MGTQRRRFNLGIWWLAAGYFVLYAPFAALIKVITGGPWPGAEAPISGFQILPAALLATVLTTAAIISTNGWWGYAGRRRLWGREVPVPRLPAALSGVGAAVIVVTTMLAFTSEGVSLLLTLLLLRGGVLIIGPLLDLTFKRRVRWFSWAAFALSLSAVLLALADVSNYRLTAAAVLNILAYQFGYVLRLSCMTIAAKAGDEGVARRFFAEEQLVALPLLLAVAAALALAGGTTPETSPGLAQLWASGVTVPCLLVGGLYGCLYVFGTMIYLDRRENTFCIPLNRCSSIVSGVLASLALAALPGLVMPSASQFVGAGLMLLAIAFLSPLHHMELYLGRLSGLLKAARGAAGPALLGRAWTARSGNGREMGGGTARPPEPAENPHVLFLFVCSGNTCRSPMAEVIADGELASRPLQLPESLTGAHLRASSAGLSVSPGAPMTAEAREALLGLGLQPGPHVARPLTAELAARANRIFCMTGEHRAAVVAMIPSATQKTHCLDPAGDIEDPLGRGREVYAACALRLRDLIRLRLAEFGLCPDLQ